MGGKTEVQRSIHTGGAPPPPANTWQALDSTSDGLVCNPRMLCVVLCGISRGALPGGRAKITQDPVVTGRVATASGFDHSRAG